MTQAPRIIETTTDGITIQADLTGLNDDLNRYKGYDIDDLRKVFDLVCDPEDWRAPIAVLVLGEAVLPVVAAIEFHTATNPTVSLNIDRMQYLITSEGYRNGPTGP